MQKEFHEHLTSKISADEIIFFFATQLVCSLSNQTFDNFSYKFRNNRIFIADKNLSRKMILLLARRLWTLQL